MPSELISIGEVARTFGLDVSALRYYDDMKLVTPVRRQGGKRWYGQADLRRPAFVKLMHGSYSMSPAEVKILLDHDDGSRRQVVDDRLTIIARRIRDLERAQDYLRHVQNCRNADPVADCPTLGRGPAQLRSFHPTTRR